MKISINDQRKIKTIQEEFTANYPYLKIEFFSRPHTSGAASPKSLVKPAEKTLGECRTRHNNGHLSIKPSMTVSELEQGFEKLYGLHVQVFRKSGKVWLETTVTDGWTLEQQNLQGETLCSYIANSRMR